MLHPPGNKVLPLALSPNMQGALLMAVSMAGFTVNDILAKSASATMNMGQVMLVRGVFASLLVIALAWYHGALKRRNLKFHPMFGLRIVGEASATVSFLLALAHLPIANVSAVLQALPLAVTMGAALVYGEQVGWRRWVAIVVGFAGVMVVVRPGFEGFSSYSLLALLCVVCCTVRDLATKQIPAEIPSLVVSSGTAIAVTLCGLVLFQPLGGWSPLTASNVGMLAAAACMLVIGYQGIIMAMRVGEISFIAPFRYTALLWALVLGYLVFNDVPDVPMYVGAALIVASGIYAIYREHVVGRRRIVAETTEQSMAPDGL